MNYPAIKSPNLIDIGFAAGFFEGEGSISLQQGLQVKIGQNDREVLDKIRDYFGGKVYGPYKGPTGNEHYYLTISKERAIGFLLTIFTLLSRSRREQIKGALIGAETKRVYKEYSKLNKAFGVKDPDINKFFEQTLKTRR